jgi:hypothetical protein
MISETDRPRATEEGRKGGTDIRGSAEGKRGRRALFWGSQIIPLQVNKFVTCRDVGICHFFGKPGGIDWKMGF